MPTSSFPRQAAASSRESLPPPSRSPTRVNEVTASPACQRTCSQDGRALVPIAPQNTHQQLRPSALRPLFPHQGGPSVFVCVSAVLSSSEERKGRKNQRTAFQSRMSHEPWLSPEASRTRPHSMTPQGDDRGEMGLDGAMGRHPAHHSG